MFAPVLVPSPPDEAQSILTHIHNFYTHLTRRLNNYDIPHTLMDVNYAYHSVYDPNDSEYDSTTRRSAVTDVHSAESMVECDDYIDHTQYWMNLSRMLWFILGAVLLFILRKWEPLVHRSYVMPFVISGWFILDGFVLTMASIDADWVCSYPSMMIKWAGIYFVGPVYCLYLWHQTLAYKLALMKVQYATNIPQIQLKLPANWQTSIAQQAFHTPSGHMHNHDIYDVSEGSDRGEESDNRQRQRGRTNSDKPSGIGGFGSRIISGIARSPPLRRSMRDRRKTQSPNESHTANDGSVNEAEGDIDRSPRKKHSIIHRTMSDAAVYFSKSKHLARSTSRQRSHESEFTSDLSHPPPPTSPNTETHTNTEVSSGSGKGENTSPGHRRRLYMSQSRKGLQHTVSESDTKTRPDSMFSVSEKTLEVADEDKDRGKDKDKDRGPESAQSLTVPNRVGEPISVECEGCEREMVVTGDSYVCECGLAGTVSLEGYTRRAGDNDSGRAYENAGVKPHTHKNMGSDRHENSGMGEESSTVGDETIDTGRQLCCKHTCGDTCMCESKTPVSVQLLTASVAEMSPHGSAVSVGGQDLPSSNSIVSYSQNQQRDLNQTSNYLAQLNASGGPSYPPRQEGRTSMAQSDFTNCTSPDNRKYSAIRHNESTTDIAEHAGEPDTDFTHDQKHSQVSLHTYDHDDETAHEPGGMSQYTHDDHQLQTQPQPMQRRACCDTATVVPISEETVGNELSDRASLADPDAPWLMRHWQWLMNWGTVAAFILIAGFLHFLPMFFVVSPETVALSIQQRCEATRITDPTLCLTHTGQRIGNYMFFCYLLIVIASAIPYIAIVKDGYFQSVTTYTYMVCMAIDVVVSLNTVMHFWSVSENDIGMYIMDMAYSVPLLVIPVMMALWMHYFIFDPNIGDIFGPMENSLEITQLEESLPAKSSGEEYYDNNHSDHDPDTGTGTALEDKSGANPSGAEGTLSSRMTSMSRTSIHSIPLFTSPRVSESRKGSYISTSHSVKSATGSVNSASNLGPVSSVSVNSVGHSLLLAGSLCAVDTLEEGSGSDDYDSVAKKPGFVGVHGSGKVSPDSAAGEAYDHMGVGLDTSTLNQSPSRARRQGSQLQKDMYAQESMLALDHAEADSGRSQPLEVTDEIEKNAGVVHRLVEVFRRPFRGGLNAPGDTHTPTAGNAKHLHIPHVALHGNGSGSSSNNTSTTRYLPDGHAAAGTSTATSSNNTTGPSETTTHSGHRAFSKPILRTKESLLIDQALGTPPPTPHNSYNPGFEADSPSAPHTPETTKRGKLRAKMARISDFAHNPYAGSRTGARTRDETTPNTRLRNNNNNTSNNNNQGTMGLHGHPGMNTTLNLNWNNHGASSQSLSVHQPGERVLSSSLTVLPAARFNLELVLSDPILRQALLEYSISCWNSENLLCYEAIVEFETMLNNTTTFNATGSSLERVLALGYTMSSTGQLAWPIAQVKDQIEAKARMIYKNFIAPGAIMTVNISYEARARLIKVFSEAQAHKASIPQKASNPQLNRIRGSKGSSSSVAGSARGTVSSNQIASNNSTAGGALQHAGSNGTSNGSPSQSASQGLNNAVQPRSPLLNSKLFAEVKEIVGDFLLNTIRFGFRSSAQFKKCLDAYRKRREALKHRQQG